MPSQTFAFENSWFPAFVRLTFRHFFEPFKKARDLLFFNTGAAGPKIECNIFAVLTTSWSKALILCHWFKSTLSSCHKWALWDSETQTHFAWLCLSAILFWLCWIVERCDSRTQIYFGVQQQITGFRFEYVFCAPAHIGSGTGPLLCQWGGVPPTRSF